MMALRSRIVGAADGTVAIGGSRELRAAALRALGPSNRLGTGDRVALCLSDPLDLIEALAALDGAVAALGLLSPSQPPEVVAALARIMGCTVLVTDRDDLDSMPLDILTPAQAQAPVSIEAPGGPSPAASAMTEWQMTTSGTTGLPKVISHSLRSLSRTVHRFPSGQEPRWGLLYDPTRFAGMQVTLQALLGGGVLIATDPEGPMGARVARLRHYGCTHLSATPTLWRRLLMVPQSRDLALEQITLGGESVDQGILDALATAFPHARRTHIYASTEAGVGFAVKDGRAGFPASFLDQPPTGVRLKILEGLLWLRPSGGVAMSRSAAVTLDDEGYVCSGDLVRIDGERAYVLGRENGLINIGGAKVHPEMVEQAIMQVPGVRLVKVSSKPSPITGSLVMAEVMADETADRVALKTLILQACRTGLGREAMPGVVRFVDDLEMNAAGKLVRRDATGA